MTDSGKRWVKKLRASHHSLNAEEKPRRQTEASCGFPHLFYPPAHPSFCSLKTKCPFSFWKSRFKILSSGSWLH